MKHLLSVGLSLAIYFLVGKVVFAQDAPKPGPEHAVLKAMEGTWDATISMEGPQGKTESKGVATYKMDLGGLWLTSDFKAEMLGMQFTGKGLDGYDPAKKKYIAVWADSWSTAPLVLEGTHDTATNKTTMTGEGPGQDGKPQKMRTVTEMKDKDTIHWSMSVVLPDGKTAEMLKITYKRRK